MTEDERDIRAVNLIGWGFLAVLAGLLTWVVLR